MVTCLLSTSFACSFVWTCPHMINRKMMWLILIYFLENSCADFDFNLFYFRRMFYLFFESRTNKNDPVVMWLTGGPGCGSEIAVFYENGPFQIANNLSLAWNDYGWDKVFLILQFCTDQSTLKFPFGLWPRFCLFCLAGIQPSFCGSTHWNRFQLYFRWGWHPPRRRRHQQRLVRLSAGPSDSFMLYRDLLSRNYNPSHTHGQLSLTFFFLITGIFCSASSIC